MQPSSAAPLQLLHQWGTGLPPRLQRAWQRLCERLELSRPDGSSPYFSHPMALPVVPLASWVATRVGLQDPVCVQEATASAMAGYLHVRVRDDHLDEGRTPDAATLLLSDRLLQLHLQLLVSSGGAALLEPADALWRASSEAQLLETELRQTGTAHTEPHFDRLLARSEPLGLPALAVLHAADQPELSEVVWSVLRPLVRSHQLLNDFADLERDEQAGGHSWLLDRARRAGQGIHHWLLVGGGLDEATAAILHDLHRAREAAEAARIPQALSWMERRAQLVEEIRTERLQRALTALLTS